MVSLTTTIRLPAEVQGTYVTVKQGLVDRLGLTSDGHRQCTFKWMHIQAAVYLVVCILL